MRLANEKQDKQMARSKKAVVNGLAHFDSHPRRSDANVTEIIMKLRISAANSPVARAGLLMRMFLVLSLTVYFLTSGLPNDYLGAFATNASTVRPQTPLPPALERRAATLPTSRQDSPATPQAIAGAKGVVMRQEMVNLRELAERECSAPAGPSEPGMMPELTPTPCDLPAPDGATASGEEGNAASATSVTAPSASAAIASPAPSASFLALDDDGTRFPPNPSAAVGPNHLMIMADSQTRILTKTGTVIRTVSTSSFWSSLGSSLVFESRGFYDTDSNRFVFVILADPQTANSALLLAVSQTSDPTGNWTLSRVRFDSQGQVFADWPNLGLNKDWVVVTANAFNVAQPNNFNRAQIYVFDKSKLVAGTSATGHAAASQFQATDITFTVFQDTTGAGSLAPMQAYPSQTMGWQGVPTDMPIVANLNGNSNGQGILRIGNIRPNVNGTLLYVPTQANAFVPNTWASAPPGNQDFAPQLGSDKRINCLDSRIQNVVYANGSIFGVHTVFFPAAAPTCSAVQWFVLDYADLFKGSLDPKQSGRIDDPTANNFYFNPSIAANQNGDVLLAYNRSSAAQFVSANYSFRAATDPPSTLRDDTVLKAGEGPYYKPTASGRNAWGNYNALVVDKDSSFVACNEVPPASVGGDRWSLYAALLAEPTVPNTTELKVDSGRFGNPAGLQGGGTYHIFNNLKPANEGVITLTGANIYWPSQGGLAMGAPFTLNVGINQSGSDNLDGISYQNIPAQVNSLNQFNFYPFPTPITLPSGSSIVVGAKITQPPGVFPFAFDDAPSQGKTFISTDGIHFTRTDTLGFQGNAMIRAVVATTPDCSVTLDQNERSFDTLGKSVAVLTGHGECKPSVTSNASWVAIKGVGVFPGGFSVEYSVEPTPFSDPRTTTINIADKVFTLHQAGNKPLPPITVTPNSIPSGGSGFRLTANGTGFTGNSIVGWNGEARATTLVSGTQLSADISAADIATPGTARITVFDVSPGGGTSPSVNFTVNPAPDFSIGFDQSTVTAQAGTKARVIVSINRTGGFTGNVTITPPDAAGGIVPKPPDPIATTDTAGSFKLKIKGNAALGPHQLTFVGRDDSGRTHTATVTLIVQ